MYSNESREIKRVVHVIYSGLGGHAAVMFSLIEAGFFKAAEHHVVLTGVEPPMEDYTKRLNSLGIAWTYIPKIPGRKHIAFYLQLRREFRRLSPDLLFLNGLAAMPATILYNLGQKHKTMVLMRESEPVQLKTSYEWTVLALAHLFVDRIVHLTKEAAEGARDKLGFFHRHGKVEIIPNGIDTNFFKPSQKQRKPDQLSMAMVSRLQHKKDHMSLLAAFQQLREMRPNIQMSLHIAGDGATKPKIEAQIKLLKLEDSVVMHGSIGREEIRDLLASQDIYLHTTYGETMSNSIMQAMATQLPIIASDVNGVSNMIGSEYGVLYPSEDVEQLLEKMLDWTDSADSAEVFSQRARERAEQEYDIRKVVERYERLVCNFLGMD